ncbi:MAG: molybdopterin-dependent oxidoreductase [Syntrophales bacterium]|jgi:NADH dehydrogenase/NADH:ubiquinone oxidoreductase subunit G|nr:molybdopterin-dependent oxidoreductase [Syntrophales bacterium]MCK9527232.1 molybdopterin-dependent oxidoreductase [Syntrophales bacterium]MDX9921298.1 molybdopterin-dependent oxidoreductase [Syntrophales bacterium]
MITLKINGREVSVEKGATILEAAEKAGVFIPTLCHDKRLAPFGSCRLCVVQNRESRRLIPSCFTPARDGMDIVTDSPAVLESVRRQLQLILINHPLECPVCDKAGECTLQDLVVRYNITELPYELEKPERFVDILSPMIERDMSRCIHCGRCVRICTELEGRHELDFMNRGIRMYIGTDGRRPLDCDFCGLCVSTCPVGALNDKLFKNTTRVWKPEKKESLCGHCGIGCPLVFHVEKNEIRRVTTPIYASGMQGFACVRGRFGWKSYQGPHRLTAPRAGGREASWPEALEYTASALKGIQADRGGRSLAFFSSDSLTLEEADAWQRFCRLNLGTPHMGSFAAAGYRHLVEGLTETIGPGWKAADLSDFQHAEVLLVVGGGAAELHPVLKQLINIYRRKEEHELVVLSPWIDYCTERSTLSLTRGITPGSQERCITEMADALADNKDRTFSDVSSFGVKPSSLVKIVSLLQGDREITLVIVPDMFGNNDHLLRVASVLHDRVRAILPLGAHCNSRGAVLEAGFSGDLLPGGMLPGDAARGISAPGDLIEAIDRGEITGLYLLGDDPLETFPDPERTRMVFRKLDLLVVQSPWDSTVASMADVVLPSTCVPEKSGHMVSLFGMKRSVEPAIVPPGTAKSDGAILEELMSALGLEPSTTAGGAPGPEPFGSDGSTCRVLSQPVQPEERSAEFPFLMMHIPVLFGDTQIAHRSPELAERKQGIRIIMNPDDFTEGFYEQDEDVILSTPSGRASGRVRYSYSVRSKVLLVENLAGSREGLALVRPGRSVTVAGLCKATGNTQERAVHDGIRD